MNIKKKIKKLINKSLKSIKIKKKYNFKIYDNEKYGDYQINDFIKISKLENKKINFLLNNIKNNLLKNILIKKIEIEKPGFLNIYIKKNEIIKIINKYSKLKKFGIKNNKKKTIIIDYSSPNIAKEMHVGHLRSITIGDSIANMLEFLDNKVIRINHIGDWGTQLGMLIYWIKEKKIEKKINKIQDLEKIYILAQKKFNENIKFAKKSRKYVVLLQKGDKQTINIWKKITKLTITQNQKIYKLLYSNLNNKNIQGESFYNNMLKDIVKDLLNKKIAQKDQKSIVIFTNKKPLIIKKKDGAYLYNTIDLACAKYRYEKLKAQKIIYITDSRQKEYLKQIFHILRKAKYIPKQIILKHYYFGMILNKNLKPLKTREGNTIKLRKFIKFAIKKTINLFKKKKKKSNLNIIKYNSYKIAISAIKYTDLYKHRKKNYIFDINKMISFKGNTGPYIQYGYIRIISILKKNKTNITKAIKFYKLININKIEFSLIKKITNFEEIIKKSSKGKPHIMCHYLYKITVLFSNFYETNNIKYINNIKIKNSKIKLIAIIAKILKIGLSLLGIPILKKL